MVRPILQEIFEETEAQNQPSQDHQVVGGKGWKSDFLTPEFPSVPVPLSLHIETRAPCAPLPQALPPPDKYRASIYAVRHWS